MIKAADRALADKDTEIKTLKLGLTNCGQDTRLLETKVQEKDQQLGAWYRNPWIMLGIGLAAGAFLYSKR